MPEDILLPPDPRTIEGLRDTGYDPTDALEDIVDNSITADATVVRVDVFDTNEDGIMLTVADNGHGMDEEGLRNAMTYGSKAKPDPASLGKFGLGLKTASTSMCRRVTCISRSGEGQEVHAAAWDLDYVAEQNAWLLQRPDPTAEQIALLDEAANGGSGTIVIWQKIDRLVRDDYASPASAKQALRRRVKEFKESMSVTYMKFLDDSLDRPKLSLVLNDEPISPWDPFQKEISSLLYESEQEVGIAGENGETTTASFQLRAYCLPPRSQLTKQQQDEAKVLIKNQGIYVYRENRLIARANWLGLRSPEPHLNLARIEFSFDHRLDAAFQIDIKKSRILLQPELQSTLSQLLNSSLSEAQQRYRKNQTSQAITQSGSAHDASNGTIGKQYDGLTGTSIKGVDGGAVIQNSKGKTRVHLTFPSLDVDVSNNPHVLVEESLEDGGLYEPTHINEKQAVLINGGHPFYQRVYSPNIIEGGTAIQGLDFLFWALCQAEWAVINNDETEHMHAVRREVSRVTRKLALDLPETEIPTDSDG